VPHTM